MSYELDVFHLIWILGLFVVAGFLGMFIGSSTSMRKHHAQHQKTMHEKHCDCSCHRCG